MNGYSEASIVCGGNIGDPGFYLYLAKVKQKLQKILKTDREDLLIEKVERWNSVRVTFRLPRNSADILRSLAEQRAETLRNLGIRSVQVGAGLSVSLAGTANAAATNLSSAQSPSTVGISRNQFSTNDLESTAIAATSHKDKGPLEEGRSVEPPRSIDIMANNQRADGGRVLMQDGPISTDQQAPTPSGSSFTQQRQPNLLGYLLDEPDQAPPPPPPPSYHDYTQHQQQQCGVGSSSTPVQAHAQPPFHHQTGANVGWSQHYPPARASTIATSGQGASDYYYYHGQQQVSPQLLARRHRYYASEAPGTSGLHSIQERDPSAYSGTNPAYHCNVNYGHQQLQQQNPGNASNSPLLVGLLQQNSPPPQSSTFVQPPAAPPMQNNSGGFGAVSDYAIEHQADSSPAVWQSAFPVQTNAEPANKRQKRASTTTKPKKTANNAGVKGGGGGKKNGSKRAGGNKADPSPDVLLNQLPDQLQPAGNLAASSDSSFNRDSSINSVIDSVLWNVAMAANTNASSNMASEAVADSKSRFSQESPACRTKSFTSATGPPMSHGDEAGSQCSSSPMSVGSFPIGAKRHQQAGAADSPSQHFPKTQQSVLRSVSSSSSCSSPLVTSAASAGADGANFPSPLIGGGFQDRPNHQLGRFPYQELDIVGIQRPSMVQTGVGGGNGSRLMHPMRFGTPPRASYHPQTSYDLSHHDNTSHVDSSYSMGRAATANGDLYPSPPHAAAATMTRYPFCHGAPEQYGAVGNWPIRGAAGEPGTECTTFMISSKATVAVASSAFGGADHDYLVASSQDSASAGTSNDYYNLPSSGSRQHAVYGASYRAVMTRMDGTAEAAFYNGGGEQEALVAQQCAGYAQQQSMTNWDKQPQRIARHRPSWTQQHYEHHTGVYGDDSASGETAQPVVSSPLDNFPTPCPQQQSLMSPATSHGGIMHQQLQPTAVDDPMLSGQVPAR